MMNLQLIRNATLILDYAGRRILIDPYFAPKHSRESFTGASPNPLVDLPLPPEQILQGIELVIVSHLHSDHFDPLAQEMTPKHLPLICQPGDEDFIRGKGFAQVTPLAGSMDWEGIRLTHVVGHHGTGEVETIMQNVMGFVLHAPDEPTVYWAGDTILCQEVRAAIRQVDPDVIVTHSGGAVWSDSAGMKQLILMDAIQTVETVNMASTARVIATHMEALDHCLTHRAHLRAAADAAGIEGERLIIPADGERVEI
jgi:L-ascorbate metabolism protein UlaG (beta-lactamase superfamily)